MTEYILLSAAVVEVKPYVLVPPVTVFYMSEAYLKYNLLLENGVQCKAE
jgi:hypothetical protein